MNQTISLILTAPNGQNFVFDGAEVPQEITFGGQQMLAIHKKIGGRRTIDSLGPDDIPLSWAGIFLFNSALSRARYLDSLRRQGGLCTLAWDELRYTVKFSDFHANYKKPYHIPYSITFEVVEDQTALITSVPKITPIQAIQQDMARANAIFGCIGDSTLSGLGSTLQTVLNAITSAVQPIANGLVPLTTAVAGAAQCAGEIADGVTSTVATAVAPFAALDAQVQKLITNSETAVSSVATIGGIAPGNSVAQTVGKSLSQINASVQLPELYELQSISTRMQANLHLIQSPTSTKTITVGGGDLQRIAAEQYGDATRWTDIASANGLSDPVLTGIQTLTIPA